MMVDPIVNVLDPRQLKFPTKSYRTVFVLSCIAQAATNHLLPKVR